MTKRGGVKIVLCLIGLGLFILAPNKLVAVGEHLIINEVQINGAGGTQEDFIELYNPTSEPINLKGYRLVKRTKVGTSDTSIKSWTGDEYVAAGGYYLWANSANGFADSIGADVFTTQTIAADNGIALRFGKENEGEIIDSVGWGACANIFVENSVFPNNPEAGQSLERNNFIDTDNNANDFLINLSPSPQSSLGSADQPSESFCGDGQKDEDEECDDGNSNNGDGCDSACVVEKNGEPTDTSFASSTSTIPADSQASFRWGEVVINEFVADPSDNDTEWIEIFNASYKEIDLSGWLIEDGSGAKTKLSGKLGTSGDSRFFVINKPAGSLNNAGDLIILKYKDGIIDKVAYGNWDEGDKDNNAPTARDPYAVARRADGYNTGNSKNDFAITTTLTKGKSNIITISAEDENKSQDSGCGLQQDVFISEIFPNPIGATDDQEEFIELYNQSSSDINLFGWSLGDNSKKRYEFKSGAIIGAGSFLAVYRPESGLSLNNDEDTVKLFKPDCEETSEAVKYSGVKEGWSYNNAKYASSSINVKNKWVWSDKVTPGQSNDMPVTNEPPEVAFDAPAEVEAGSPVFFDSSDTTDESTSSLKYFWDFADGATSTLANPEHTFFKTGSFKIKLTVSDGKNEASKIKTIKVVKKGSVVVKGTSTDSAKAAASKTATTKKAASNIKIINLDKVKEMAKGDRVKVEGAVAILPNIFSSQYFYIVGSGGVQVYSYKKDFPELKVGDIVSVTGEISIVSGEKRIKTNTKDDIKIIKNEKEPEPEVLSCENIDEESVGHLVSVVGEVTEKKGYTIFLDDGTDEAQVYLKKNTGLSNSDFTEGDKIEVRGIVGQSGTNLRIMPRSKDDLIRQNDEAGEVLGEVSQSDGWQLAQRDKKMELLKYFLAIAVFIILGLVIFIFKKLTNK